MLEVDLVHDPHPRRHDAEPGEGLLGPSEQRIPLVIALVLAFDIDPESLVAAERVDLDGVVNH
jgi:hypothetical protein